MKKLSTLLTILSFLICLTASSQVTYTFRYYSKVLFDNVNGYWLVAMPSDSLTNPNKRPVFWFEPGFGETTTGNCTEAKAALYGYLRDLYLGLWNGGVKQSNGYTDSIVYPIYMVAQYGEGQTNTLSRARHRWLKFYADYSQYIDTNQVHQGGISLGGRQGLYFVSNAAPGDFLNKAVSHLPATFLFSSPGSKSTAITDSSAVMGQYASKGGKVIIATGQSDPQNVYFPNDVAPYFNSAVPGSAIGYTWRTGVDGFTSEGHDGWDTLYKNDRHFPFLEGKSVYEWQLQYTKTPKAVAQSTINTSSNTVTLNGVSNGWHKTVAWTKVSGGSATITNSNKDTTTVTGLTPGTYVFRMTVTNTGDSRTATHDVTVNVKDCGYAEDTYSPTVTATTNFSQQYLNVDRITFLNFKTFNLYSRVNSQSAGASSFSVTISDRVGSSLRGVGSGSIVYDNGTVKPISCTATGTTMTCKFEAVSGSQGTIHISGEYQ